MAKAPKKATEKATEVENKEVLNTEVSGTELPETNGEVAPTTGEATVTGEVDPIADSDATPTADVPAGTESALAALLATAQTQSATPPAAAGTAPRAARSSVTVHKINSASARDANGNPVQRRNTTVGDRQVVAIISESAKLAHITTDINYAILTQAGAVNKANKELIKQQEIKIICNNPDLKVLVTQQRWSIDVQPGDTIPLQQRAKAEVYHYFQQKGFTMLGRIRRNAPGAGSLPIGEISFVEVGAVDVTAAPVVLGADEVQQGVANYQAKAAELAAAEEQRKAQQKAQKSASAVATTPAPAPVEQSVSATDLQALLAQSEAIKPEVTDAPEASDIPTDTTSEDDEVKE